MEGGSEQQTHPENLPAWKKEIWKTKSLTRELSSSNHTLQKQEPTAFHRMMRKDTPTKMNTDLCGSEKLDVEHFLLWCPSYMNVRAAISD